MSEALYRKYRPQVFEDVVGQDPIVRTLQNAIAQNKVSHAYLFCGPRGTGKTTMARLLSKALLCGQGPTPNPDGTCEDCEMIAAGRHPDVYELDAASRTGVENVREEIIGRVQFAPTRGSKKIYIIDEVHMLSTAAFNALLKTLEEPPEHVVFVLCTTDPQKVPETIHSRCQRFDFKRIGLEGMVANLGAVCGSEDCAFEGEALELIAHRADGGMRNALTSLEQLMAFSNKNITLEAAESMLGGLNTNDVSEFAVAVGKRDVPACFAWIAKFIEAGGDLSQFAYDFAEYVRGMYVVQIGGESSLDVSDATRNQMREHVQWFGTDRLLHDLCILGDVIAELKTSTNARLSFEIAAVRMARPASDLTLESLAERIESLERGGVNVAQSQQPDVRAARDWRTGSSPVQGAPAQGALAQDGSAQSVSGGQTVNGAIASRPSPVMGSWGRAAENPAALQRAWQQVMGALKRISQPHAVMFMNAQAVFVPEKQAVEVQFPPTAEFTFKMACKPEVVESLGRAITETLGAPAPFELVRTGGSTGMALPNVNGGNNGQPPQGRPAGSAGREGEPAQSGNASAMGQPSHVRASSTPDAKGREAATDGRAAHEWRAGSSPVQSAHVQGVPAQGSSVQDLGQIKREAQGGSPVQNMAELGREPQGDSPAQQLTRSAQAAARPAADDYDDRPPIDQYDDYQPNWRSEQDEWQQPSARPEQWSAQQPTLQPEQQPAQRFTPPIQGNERSNPSTAQRFEPPAQTQAQTQPQSTAQQAQATSRSEISPEDADASWRGNLQSVFGDMTFTKM